MTPTRLWLTSFFVRPLHPSAHAEMDTKDVRLEDIAIQLLASTSTDYRYCSEAILSLPAALYVDRGRKSRISALKMHTQFRFSPATGYVPRNNSPEPAWPGLSGEPSREERLAEQICRQRRIKARQDGKLTKEVEEHYGSPAPLQEEDLTNMEDHSWLTDEDLAANSLTPVSDSPSSLETGLGGGGDDLLIRHLGARFNRSRSFWFGHIRAKSSG